MASSDKALKVLGSDNELFGLILTVLILAVKAFGFGGRVGNRVWKMGRFGLK